ncbi:RES family NAD+ phosphorylase [Acinetobacter sp. WU_MDCI_Abxb74]|uniref:RES family NAD+ phosphorylase n=1 Tax=Acinetobacter sp. WU_MDCI_Abxb74 TaxID=2850072 RepID=UPI0021CDAE9F|nr:RES family NAD+ phosphorylase [Acinetobacter sp. WU_MDCI_Abxb74]MCU4423214.1 RES family NAD+ phosphorylase [Acinetobacter sp. WU_MDCI_Abxb74]
MFKSNIDIETIKKNIFTFRERAKNGSVNENILYELTSIFGNRYVAPCEFRSIPNGTTFFRARGIPSNDITIPFNTVSNVGDAWEPPSEFVKYPGRLNNINQSILYCCPDDPYLAIKEARASENNFVAIMKYKAIREIIVTALGDYERSNLPKDDLTRLFYSFLDEEFAQDVKPGEESRYTITRAVADSFANLPNQDGWLYRSVQSPEKFNVAFLPNKHRECIELEGVLICDLSGSDGNNLKVISVVDFDRNDNAARYHAMGSKEQQELFPELISR